VLQYLTVSRRGLDVDRLVNLWYGFAHVGDPAASADAGKILRYLEQLSFVKERHGRYFLHDEFYTLYQQRFTRLAPLYREADRAEQIQFFERMVTYCEQAIRPLTDRLAELRDTVQSTNGSEDDRQIGSELQDLLARRRQFQAELIHYALYLDPQNCVNTTWFELSSQALSSEDLLMDVQIRSEVDLFFFGIRPDLNRIQAGLSEEDWDLIRLAVVDTRISSIIRSYMSVGEYVRATNFYQMVDTDHRALMALHYPSIHATARAGAGMQLHEWFRNEWAAFRSITSIYLSGQAAKNGIAELEAIDHYYQQQHLEDRSTPVGMFAERFRGVWAQIIMYIGYGHVTFNDFQRAMVAYRRALTILRPTKFKALPAEVKNNLSRVLGEIGAIDEALSLSDEVIATRRELGFDYLLAISFNTRALIRTRNERPQTAQTLAARARDICRRQGKQRGIGLAQTQYGEATRKWWNSTLEEARVTGLPSFQANLAELNAAADGLREALQIFGIHEAALNALLGSNEALDFERQELIIKELIRNEPPPEPLRIVEALLEIACLHRDRLAARTNDLNRSFNYHRSERFFQIALLVANYYLLPRHRLSAWIDLAWLYQRYGRLENAQRILQVAIADVPEEYWINAAGPLHANLTDIVYFRELSELWALRAELISPQAGKRSDDEAKALLTYRIVALVYIELFSPKHETSYLKLNRSYLRTLLEKLIAEEYTTTALRSYVATIRSTYHLAALRPNGRFAYEDVVEQQLGTDEH
jgi:tetratricopeptide (TPR) repeat protein